MSVDIKKTVILIAGCNLGITLLDKSFGDDVVGVNDLETFLSNENCLILYAVLEKSGLTERLQFLKNVEKNNFDRLVILSKEKPCIITQENLFTCIQVSSISGPPTIDLYYSLSNIFTPLLEQKHSQILQKHICNIKNDLGSFTEKTDYKDERSQSTFNSLENEIKYWSSEIPIKKDRYSKATGASFIDILTPLSHEFSYLNALSFMEIEEVLEKAHNVLDDLWRHEPSYPQDRIKYLMTNIGQDICKYMSKNIKNFWDGEFNKEIELVTQLINIGEKWKTSCKQLTELFWPNYSSNMWKEGVYIPLELNNYVLILHEAINIKTLHKQLIKLLTPEEQEELKTEDMLKPLKEKNILNYEELLPNTLIMAKKQFEILLQPAEKCVAMKLKKHLSSLNASTRQLIYEFSRYSEIITRPILKQALLSERQFLLSLLYEYIKVLQSKISSENDISTNIELSTTLKDIILVKKIETRIKEVKNMADEILNDLEGYNSLNQQVNEIIVDLKQQNTELYQSWVNEILMLIKNDILSLKETDPVVQFSKHKFMKVNYSNRFVMLISEVRQLRSMGFHIPNQINETSNHAKKFVKHARTLDQIANFHNTIGDRMIPSLKPLMLKSALELSKLVQEQEVVSWSDEQSVENYVSCLKIAVEKLSKENNMLTMYHAQVLEKINELEDVDLINDYSKWKDNLRVIKNIVTQVENKGFTNMQLWKNEIDKQISKLLEKQYIKSLNTVHLYLPEIYTNLVYKNDQISFSPDEVELRKQYDQQLKKFLELPKQFRGISETSDTNIYTDIIYVKNKDALNNVSKHTDELFGQLQLIINHWKSWIQLEDLDVNKLTNSKHWDLHFRSSKIFGQEVAKLPNNEEKLGCIIVGLSKFKLDLELHNRNYWDRLIYSLKDSIAQDVVKLQNFVDPATSALTKQTVTFEELADIGAFHGQIKKDLPDMQTLFDEMLLKSVTLSSWSREQVDSVNRLNGAWERLLSLIDSHHSLIEKQMDNIKISLNVQIENLNKELEHFSAKWCLESSNLYSNKNNETLEVLLAKIKSKKLEWNDITLKKDKIMSDINKFNIDTPEMEIFNKVELDLKKEIEFENIFEEFYQELISISNEYWIVFRKKTYLLDDFFNNWENKLKGEEINESHKLLLSEMQKYKEIYPLLKYVRGEDFSNKHWMDVFNILQMDPKPIDQLILNDWFNVSENIKAKKKELQLISKKAAGEIVVQQALNELEQWDAQAKFILIEHNDSKNKPIMVIKEFKEVLNKMSDIQSLLQSLKNANDNDSVSDKTTLWENKLTDLEFYVTSLAQIQRKWLYLEPIFNNGTLANEKQRFDRIDRSVRNILAFMEKDNHVSFLCRYLNLRSLLNDITDQLSRCQNNLNNFLLEKRNKFPRFYFLSDDDLLEVVGQSSKENVIQSHLKKLFSGINTIQFTDSKITALCSLEGEIVKLSNPINIQQPIEEWLDCLVKEMQITLKELLVQCQNERDAPDPFKYPSQILCLSDNITFTLKCEQAISSLTLSALLNKYKAQLKYYSSLEIHEPETITSLPEYEDSKKSLLEIKLKALLLDTIHHINVLENLIDNNTSKVTDWAWQKQLRFYSNSLGDVTVKMAHSRMEYSYEYLGNAPKLVRTPLTDRCFLTLTQSLYLGMGGNPYGPAGTGKTESVKDLGQLLGRQVLVFNCDEGIDAKSMGRIISGLVRSGAWGCFDEFNRLDEGTLSAVSMLIQPVQVALRTNCLKFNLLNQEMVLNKHCGIFVTLNPAGSSYGGRNKLPDNLKQLFRPVVMTHPDHEGIAKSLLHCDGYQYPSVLATKIIEVFDLSSQLLSKQKHYDWGLRAIGTVLVGCSSSLKSRKLKSHSTETLSLDEELKLVVEVLRINTLSKLTFSDSVKFDSIIKDVFKGVSINSEYGNSLLVKALEECFHQLKLIPNQRQINKCLEVNEQLKQRMGVAIIGPPGCGKTTIRELLFMALKKIGKNINTYAFNPRSMTRLQLLGYLDVDTNQWNDGVLTSYSLKVAAEPPEIWSCILCDGDIDPDWVESLNSVLDDNRILTFSSGWRIQFGRNVNFLFESHNLTNASPATISRMGVVFLSEEDLQVDLITKKFINELPDDKKTILEFLIQDSFVKAINWIKNNAEVTLPSTKLSLVKTGLSFMQNVKNKAEFTVSLANGLGQQLQYDFVEIFVNEVFNWLGEPEPPLPLSCKYDAERDMIDSYVTNPNIFIEDVSKGLPLILTGQILKTLDYLRVWMESVNKTPFLLVGPHGSAKRLILEHVIQEKSNIELVTINCSFNLTPTYIINKLTQRCLSLHTHKGKFLRPKKGNLILYMRNLTLLKHDKWGTNITIEFLNQIIEYGGFYDSNIEFIGLENVQIIGSTSQTNTLSERFISKIYYYNVLPAQQDDFVFILSTYLSAILKEILNISWSKTKIIKLSAMMIDIFEKIKTAFTPNMQKHYIFSPHDVINWSTNLIRYNVEETNDNENNILKIICYEAKIMFYNKLVSQEDKDKFTNIVNNSVQQAWEKSNIMDDINYFYVPNIQVSSYNTSLKLQKLTKEEWQRQIKQGLIYCEREGMDMNMIINDELTNLCSVMSKHLSGLGQNLVLLGISGVGRRSSIKILSALLSAKHIVISSENTSLLHMELKTAMQIAGVEGDQVFLQIDDYVFQKESNMDLINMLISAGEVPDLYNPIELDSITKHLKDEVDRVNFEGSLFDFFSQRIKSNLHVIFCLDINNHNLSNIFEQTPVLNENCNITWNNTWSKEALSQIPLTIIKRDIKEECLRTTECSDFIKIYNNISKYMPEPSRFLSMIKLYSSIYDEKFENNNLKQTKLKAGILKLDEAKQLVNDLKVKANEQQQKLSEKQDNANSALDMISSTMKSANSKKELMENLKQQTEDENIQIVQRKKQIEKELSEVEPLIQEARSAVGSIKSESLSEIRSLRAPPEVIRDILEGVLRLMGIQDTSWNSMKTFLAKRGVKEEIRTFDASRITTENRLIVERLLSNKSESFDEKSAKRASLAAAPLAGWVKANVKYSHVMDKIKPLEKEQNKLQKNLKEAELNLKELSSGLLDVDATVIKLKEKLSAYTKEAAEIEIDLNRAKETLNAAENLVLKLNDEYERWQMQLVECQQQLMTLHHNCLLASTFINYISNTIEEGRESRLKEWKIELNINEFNFESFLSMGREQLLWQSQGLHLDALSIQNAISILKSTIVPLIIDPTLTAINWLKEHLKQKNLECLGQNSLKFNTSLEHAIRFGKTLIIEEIEQIPSILYPLLRNEYIQQGERKLIRINGKILDFNYSFKLILCSRNTELQIARDVKPLINIINFTVTRVGLTNQLLLAAIKQVKPDLENKRKSLLSEREKLTEKQEMYQHQLLEDLVNSTGDILQNTNLIKSLNETKASSMAINKALTESMELQNKLQQEYDSYQDFSSFGSQMYFSCNEFSRKNVLYLISVSAFSRLFLKSLESFQVIEKKVDSQMRHLFSIIYNYMARGIFKQDRLKFLLHLAHKLYPSDIPEREWNTFLSNSVSATRPLNEEFPPWIPEHCVHNIYNLKNLLPELYTNLKLNESQLWSQFLKSDDVEISYPNHVKLTDFQKILIVQALCPEKLYSSMQTNILQITGLKSLEPHNVELIQILKESVCFEPILILSMPGTDPSIEIKELAQQSIGKDNFVEIAMGEGQETLALNNLKEMAETEKWLILKNVQLVTNWLPFLCQSFKDVEKHKNFRLWLISEPTSKFNSVLTQNSLKFVYEATQGIRNNLLRSFASFGRKYFESLNSTASRIFFIICCIHALLQERRKYIPQGWSKYYDFSDSDLSTCIKLIEDVWQNPSTKIQWAFISGLFGETVYGGRIERNDDMKILQVYVNKYFVDEVLSHQWRLFGKTNLPNSASYDEYVKVIMKLPQKDVPSYFGLPDNIDRAWEVQNAFNVIKGLKDIHILKQLHVNFDKEVFQKGLQPFISLWKKINQGHDFVRITISDENFESTAIKNFIHEEFTNALYLTQYIHKCFANLNKVCKGMILPSKDVIEIGSTLLNYKTPLKWINIWSGPKEPMQYLRTILRNLIFLSKLRDKDENIILQNPINLSNFFNPKGVLASHKLDVSRITNIALDELSLQTNWKKTNDHEIIIENIFVEGALFEGSTLKNCLSNSNNFNPTPNCYISWKSKIQDDQNKYLSWPLYTRSDREEKVTDLNIYDDSKESDKWIFSGLSFFLEY